MSRDLEIAHLVIAAGAASCAAATLAAAGLKDIAIWRHPMVFWVGSLAGWTYTVQRWWKWRSRPEELPENRRIAFEKSPWSGLLVWTVVALAATFTLLAHRPPAWTTFLPWACGAGLLSVGYAIWPAVEGGLRSFPGMKLPLIAITWAWATVLLPLSAEGLDLNLWAFAGQMLFIAGITIPFDVRDMNQDADALGTLPQRIGAHRAIRLALLLLAISAGIFVVAPQIEWVRMGTAVGAMPIVAWGVVPRNEAYYTFALDGMLVVQAVAIWL
ncbi:MAG: hypothetical protein ACPGYK_02010 [Flavobacteriales bacterium]